MRGEYYILRKSGDDCEGSPPHARGIQFKKMHKAATGGITPACAGNTTTSWCGISGSGDHPRMRGEYFRDGYIAACEEGSPPHARGILRSSRPALTWPGITPACAGNTDRDRVFFVPGRDHPRMRGEYARCDMNILDETGSPPHARGIPQGSVLALNPLGITPACAGNTNRD